MQRTSDWRRYRRELAIARVEGWMRDRGLWTGRRITVEESAETYSNWARRRHSARASCSGPCCGNPRRHHGELTPAELRAADSAREQLGNIGIAIPQIRH